MHPNPQLRVFIDLEVIQENYKNLSAFTKTPMASVLKANGYGLGAVPIAEALVKAGCRTFFVATVGEAIDLRSVVPKSIPILLLHGCFEEEIQDILAHDLIPVLNNPKQLALWKNVCDAENKKLPCYVHFDTGMNRLGFDAKDIALVKEAESHMDIQHIMSHLACAADTKDPYNGQQRQRFLDIIQHFPGKTYSLSASEGIGLGESYYFDLIRAGITFYGIIPYAPHTQFAIRPQARILQTRFLKAGDTIGYNQRYTASSRKRVGTLAIGFADGLTCAATNNAHVYVGGYEAPIIGRVSMDLTVVDLSHVPEEVAHESIWVDLFRDNMSHLRSARESGMALYEVTCRIGERYQKIYKK